MPKGDPVGATVRLDDREVQAWGIVALVRNHPGHADEMRESAPPDPVAFVKPPTSVFRGRRLELPTGAGRVEFEAELAVYLDRELRHANESEARRAVAGVGVCLDLTLRELQGEMKQMRWPWLVAKGFDRAGPVSPFVAAPPGSLGRLRVVLEVNDETRQDFTANEYLHPPERALAKLSHRLTLPRGTIVALGSGPGVGPLEPGDAVRARVEAGDDELTRLGFRVSERSG